MPFGNQQYGYSPSQWGDGGGPRRRPLRPQQVTAANAPLWQARPRLGAQREMMDAYFGKPTFADANTGYALKMKGRAYRNKLAVAYAKRNRLGPYRRRVIGRGY